MTGLSLGVCALLAAAGGYFVFWPLVSIFLRTYRGIRGPRIVTCPKSGRAVEVEFDEGRAAITSLIGAPTLRVKRCSRWSAGEERGCRQACTEGVDAALACSHGLLTRPLRQTGL
jgi:hypothetical protein